MKRFPLTLTSRWRRCFLTHLLWRKLSILEFYVKSILAGYLKIHTLVTVKLRKTYCYSRGDLEIFAESRLFNGLQLALGKLFGPKLTVLDVCMLDASGLAKAVRCLPLLPYLRASEMLDNIGYDLDSQSTPLAVFLRELYAKFSPRSSVAAGLEASSDLSDSDESDPLDTIPRTNPRFHLLSRV